MAQIMNRIFVYGTLKRGEPNYHFMTSMKGTAKLLAEVALTCQYPLVVGTNGIPYMLPRRGRGEYVHGELYEVDQDKLQLLDELEHHPHWYVRTAVQATISKPVSLECLKGSVVDCEIYILRDDHLTEELLSLPCIANYSNSTSTIKYVFKQDRSN